MSRATNPDEPGTFHADSQVPGNDREWARIRLVVAESIVIGSGNSPGCPAAHSRTFCLARLDGWNTSALRENLRSADMKPGYFRDSGGQYELVLPVGWETEPDGEGGVLLYKENGCGLLHLMPFARDADDEIDPAEELYAFLADQEIELEEDEVADVALRVGSLAVCEYIADDEDDEFVYWLVGVATAPGKLVFASYSCPSGEEDSEVGSVREILASLSFDAPSPPNV